MIFQVTEEDILHGKRGNCFSCPVARSIQRTLNCYTVSVGITSYAITMHKGGPTSEGSLPWLVSDWIMAFEGCKIVQPFSFELEVLQHKGMNSRTRM